ncbi:MAG: Hint domain-containing protein [Paracoccaceae bacterium]
MNAITNPSGIAAGTVLATTDGYLPVEFLEPGDRVVTRSGVQTLRAVRAACVGLRDKAIAAGVAAASAPQVAHYFELIFDRDEMVFADGIFLRCAGRA